MTDTELRAAPFFNTQRPQTISEEMQSATSHASFIVKRESKANLLVWLSHSYYAQAYS